MSTKSEEPLTAALFAKPIFAVERSVSFNDMGIVLDIPALIALYKTLFAALAIVKAVSAIAMLLIVTGIVLCWARIFDASLNDAVVTLMLTAVGAIVGLVGSNFCKY